MNLHDDLAARTAGVGVITNTDLRAILARHANDKRLTDAEIAAEYYKQDSKCRYEQWIETVRGDDDYTDSEQAAQLRMYEKLNILYRFATLPHYDEVTA